MEAVKIVVLSIAAAMLYGILHDQVTPRVCVEYFTIGHPLMSVRIWLNRRRAWYTIQSPRIPSELTQ